jgi:hypothetical protein
MLIPLIGEGYGIIRMEGGDLEFAGPARPVDRAGRRYEDGNVLELVAMQILDFAGKIILGGDRGIRETKD